MRRISVQVAPDKIASRFETTVNLAVAKAIHTHKREGRDTYTIRNDQIIARQPSGRSVVVTAFPTKDLKK